MKFGYLRRDDDGHNYVVPEELIEEFDADQKALENSESEEDYYRMVEAWNDKWYEYNEGGSVSHYKVVIQDSPIVWVVLGASESGDDYGPVIFWDKPSEEKLKEMAHDWDGCAEEDGPGNYGSYVYLAVDKVRIK